MPRPMLYLSLLLTLAACGAPEEAAAPPAVTPVPTALATATPAAPSQAPPMLLPAPTPRPLATARPTTPQPIGTLDTGQGAWALYFTTAPGSRGLPKTRVRAVAGETPVYEVYDWAEKDPELAGESGHRWYRVDPVEPHWVFGLPDFRYQPHDPPAARPADAGTAE